MCFSVDNKPPEFTDGVYQLLVTAGESVTVVSYMVTDPDNDDITSLELKVNSYQTKPLLLSLK